MAQEISQTSSTANQLSINDPPALDAVGQEVLASELVARLMPKYQALSPAELLQVNIDIPSAVATSLGAVTEIRNFRSEITADLPNFDLQLFDDVESYALALNDVHGSFLVANQPNSELQAVLVEATEVRETLLADTTSLSHRGLVDGRTLEELKGPVGHKNLATDLNMLVKTLQASQQKIAGKSAVTERELDRATRLQQRLVRLVGIRDQRLPAVNAATDLRLRAFTSFVRAYDHARRAINYLRWLHGDADRIAPSLYAGRGGGKRKSTEATTPVVTPEGTLPAAPGLANGATLAVPAPHVNDADPFM